MSATIGFPLWFGITLALLAAVVVTGLRARRRAHIVLVVLMALCFVWTIREAYRLGEIYDLASAGWITPVHLAIARVSTAVLLLPVVTGIAVLKRPDLRRVHAKFAWLAVALMVLSAITGTWMILMSKRFAE